MYRVLTFIISLSSASLPAMAEDVWRSDEEEGRLTLQCTSKPAFYENVSAEAEGFVKSIPLANDVIPSGETAIVMDNEKLDFEIQKTLIELDKQKLAISFYEDLLSAQALGMSSKQEQLNSKYELRLAQLNAAKFEQDLHWLITQKDSLRLSNEREIVIDKLFVEKGDFVARGAPLFRFFSKDAIIYSCFVDKVWRDIFSGDKSISVLDSDIGKRFTLEALEASSLHSNSAYHARFNASGAFPIGLSKQLSVSIEGTPILKIKTSDRLKGSLWLESKDGSRIPADINALTLLRDKGYIYLKVPKGKVIVASNKSGE